MRLENQLDSCDWRGGRFSAGKAFVHGVLCGRENELVQDRRKAGTWQNLFHLIYLLYRLLSSSCIIIVLRTEHLIGFNVLFPKDILRIRVLVSKKYSYTDAPPARFSHTQPPPLLTGDLCKRG